MHLISPQGGVSEQTNLVPSVRSDDIQSRDVQSEFPRLCEFTYGHPKSQQLDWEQNPSFPSVLLCILFTPLKR